MIWRAIAYSVPWRLIGERVRVVVSGGRVRVHHAYNLVAKHEEHRGRHNRIVDRSHLDGTNMDPCGVEAQAAGAPEPALLRPLDEYAAVADGRF